MTGRILIVDGIATQRIILRVKLATACYDVAQAATGAEARAQIARGGIDLVIVAERLPDTDAATFCAGLRGPFAPGVIVLMDQADPAGRLAALRAGAEDTLVRPLDEQVLYARLRAILRAREAEHELRLRDETGRTLGAGTGLAEEAGHFAHRPRVAVVHARDAVSPALLSALRGSLGADLHAPRRDEVLRGRAGRFDVFVLIAADAGGALDFLGDLRVRHDGRTAAVLFVAEEAQRRPAITALDMGADDLVLGTAWPEELVLRIQKLVRRKGIADRLRATMKAGLRAALTDPLTGLHNRRYALPHLVRVDEAARAANKGYAVLLADIDDFKQVNDCHGHQAGDAVLAEVAQRLAENVRAADLVSRFGGEEFLVTLPDTGPEAAAGVAERLRRAIRATPVSIGPGSAPIAVTISVGVATGPGAQAGPDGPRGRIDAADGALYAAKRAGRDRVERAPVPCRAQSERPEGASITPIRSSRSA